MPLPILTTLFLGTLPVQAPAASPQPIPVLMTTTQSPMTDPERIKRLQGLVEAAEQAVEAADENAAVDRSDEADVLTADWPLELLKRPEVQALLQRLKDVQVQLDSSADAESEPGLKASEEVVAISGDELRAELERVKQAEQGASYDFPIDLNDKVLTWVKLFSTTKRGFMENALGRASQFLPMIRQVFAEEGVPSDLAYLAVIESGFRNEAKSRAKAVGMWQFIRSTGRIYGLTANSWLEERRDPVKATRAAARYLKKLYEITGDWYLATSSYNAGPLTLERAIQNLGTRNFWDLARSRWLRTETKNYVPELCAAILVGRNPERYGLNLQPLYPYVYETVAVPSMTSLASLAKCADTDVATLKTLNPELLRPSTPPGVYTLRVPPGRAVECLRRMSSLPKGKGLAYKSYRIRKGDTLAAVARRFKMDPADLLDMNDLSARQFKAGRRIQIPQVSKEGPKARARMVGIEEGNGRLIGPLPDVPPVPMPSSLPSGGDARPAPTPVPEAVAAPSTAAAVPPSPAIRAADPLPVKAPEAGDAKPLPQKTLRARPGDTLAKIARTQGVPLGELMRLNPTSVKALHPGDEVRLPGSEAGREAEAKATGENAVLTYRVQKGETLASIARKHGVTVQELKDWNHLKSGRIKRGQRLRVQPR
ncbi:MAG TPA: LysM peptidoglycan-binding domain-containing protein [Geothrix sp.]|nr:LysM peptidoglycan-binding domain-containing protein [Geothrix sp.]